MSETDRIETRQSKYGTIKILVTDRGTKYTNNECERRLKSATYALMRWFSRSIRTLPDWDDPDMRKHDIQHLRGILDDVSGYAEIVQRELDKLEGVNKQDARIAKLRALTTGHGATEGEAAQASAAIARIESRYKR